MAGKKTSHSTPKEGLARLAKPGVWAGVDEAGRGCLAGPVCAAAIILPPELPKELTKVLNDSKKLSLSHRTQLRPLIEQCAVSWAVGWASPEEIDSINILQATYLAMHRALKQLSPIPQYIAVDGNRFKPYGSVPHQCFVKGDGRFLEIAAASVLAKTHRDGYMEHIHEEYPMYNWLKNKGYPTIDHKKAVMESGRSPYHRMTFNYSLQLKFSF
jgi:ribonuclease HII